MSYFARGLKFQAKRFKIALLRELASILLLKKSEPVPVDRPAGFV